MLSYAKDIRPLFRSHDIDSMKRAGLDLGSYKDVQAAAEKILNRLEDGSMPCDGAWEKKDIDKFRQWVTDGKLP
jgi:hypothetical protein